MVYGLKWNIRDKQQRCTSGNSRLFSNIADQSWLMVHKTFGIYSEDLNACELYIEPGTDYFACWCKHPGSGAVHAFEYFDTSNREGAGTHELLQDVLHYSRLLAIHFETVHCNWNTATACCIPGNHFDESVLPVMFELMFGHPSTGKFMHRQLGELVVAAPVPEEAGTFDRQYMVQSHSHKYAALLAHYKPAFDTDSIYLHFNTSACIITVFKQGKLQLIRTIAYAVPDDVVYYVLHCCRQFDIAPDDATVIAGGMIAPGSPLFDKLYAYIPGFATEQPDKQRFAAAGFSEYPLHYFASFCN